MKANLKELERYLKRSIKGKLSFNKALVIAFLICGSFLFSNNGISNIQLDSLTSNEEKIGPDTITNGGISKPFLPNIGAKTIILAPGKKASTIKRNYINGNVVDGAFGSGHVINEDDWLRGKENVIIGHRARTIGTKAVAIGSEAFAYSNAVSIGAEAIAYNQNTVSIGQFSYSENEDDVSLGHGAFSKGSLSTALGSHSVVEAQGATAIGYKAVVTSGYKDSVALGSFSEVKRTSNITEDKKTEVNEKTWISKEFAEKFSNDKLLGVVSIGKKDEKYRQLVNLAPGTEDTDAVNLGQLREAMKNISGGVNYFSTNKLKGDKNKNNDGAKAENSLVIGSGETTTEAKGSIFISVADKEAKVQSKDSIAIGQNLNILENSEGSILLGNNSKINNTKPKSIGIGDGVIVDSGSAIAIGESAKVEAAAGDSIALGTLSKATEKKTALKGLEATISSNKLKFNWENAGTSTDEQELNKKAVLSIGDLGKERLITNVAAGKVDNGSTDAINGGQLKGVIDVFGSLGIDVLGAEVDDIKGFKKSTFTKLKDVTKQDTEVKAPETFKDAIDKNIAKLNEGLKFKADKNEESDKTHYLGTTLSIVKWENSNQVGSVAPTTPEPKFVGDNITTKYTYEKDGNAKIEIGFKEAPEFKKVKLSEEQKYSEKSKIDDKELITKGYLEQALNSFKIKIKANNGEEKELGRGDTLELKNGENIDIKVNGNQSTPSSSPQPPISSPTGSTSTTAATPSGAQTTQGKTVVATIGTNSELKNIDSITSKEKSDTKESMKIKLDAYKISILKNKGNGTAQDKKEEEILSIKEENEKGILEFAKDNLSKSKGAIKGLADLDDKSTGDMAANKNYVDRTITFKVNEKKEETEKDKNSISKKLGEELEIKGKGYKKDSFEGTDNNIAVLVETPKEKDSSPKLEISLNENLTNMNSFETKDDNGKKSKLDTNGLMVKDSSNITLTRPNGLNVGTLKDNDIDKDKANASYTKDGVTLLGEDKQDKAEYKLTETKLTDKEGNSVNIKPTEITLTDKDKKTISLKNNTISFSNNEGVISGLKAPINANDAVNKGYVDNIKGKVEKEITTLKETTNESIDSLKGGIAGVIAMANLPQISTKGHNVAAAIGQHKDKVALALGISGTNEKGNLVYKASGSITSKADISLGAGIGYQFGSYKESEKTLIDVKNIKRAINKQNEIINKQTERIIENELEMKKDRNRIQKLELENTYLKEQIFKLFKEIENINKKIKK